MKTYLLSATSVIFLSVMVSMILPEGKLSKSIIFVMRMACILVLIQPITKIFDIKTDSAEISADYEYIKSVYSDNQSSALRELLVKEFGEGIDCTVNIEYADGKFTVGEISVTVNSRDEEFIYSVFEYVCSLGYERDSIIIFPLAN